MRAILNLTLDSLPVSIERLRNNKFIDKPLIIGGLTHPQNKNNGFVISCSDETRKFGIHPSMPIKLARTRCPEAIFLHGDFDTYQKYSRLVTEVIAEQAPVFEKSAIDEFYLDLTGMDKYFGCHQWSGELQQRLQKETGLTSSYGLSVNKLIAKIGTAESKPNGALYIAAGTEKAFIAPLAVRKIPNVGRTTDQKLKQMGVRTIKVLRAIPARLLEREFGKTGISLWKKANAIDHSPVIPYSEQKTISSEKNFQTDTIDLPLLRATLLSMLEQLTFELRNQKKLAAAITLKIRYADHNTFSKQKKIPHTADDLRLKPVLLQLFHQLYQRRQRIRMVGIQFSHLVHGHPQINLFDDTLKSVNLLRQMDHIRKKFGKNSIGSACGTDIKNRLRQRLSGS